MNAGFRPVAPAFYRRPTVLIECPHCQTRVDPSHKDGVCSKCDGRVNEVNGINPNRALIVIRPTARMPEVCCQCGMPTSAMTTIVTEDDPDAAFYGLMATAPFRPLAWLVNRLRSFAKTGVELRELRVPHCEFCDEQSFKPVALHPNDDLYQCAVHIGFKRRYDELNYNDTSSSLSGIS